jgi:hypothetical protein
MEAAVAVTVESYKAWLACEARTDDISIIVVQIMNVKDADHAPAAQT